MDSCVTENPLITTTIKHFNPWSELSTSHLLSYFKCKSNHSRDCLKTAIWFRNCRRLHYPTTAALETLSRQGTWSFTLEDRKEETQAEHKFYRGVCVWLTLKVLVSLLSPGICVALLCHLLQKDYGTLWPLRYTANSSNKSSFFNICWNFFNTAIHSKFLLVLILIYLSFTVEELLETKHVPHVWYMPARSKKKSKVSCRIQQSTQILDLGGSSALTELPQSLHQLSSQQSGKVKIFA